LKKESERGTLGEGAWLGDEGHWEKAVGKKWFDHFSEDMGHEKKGQWSEVGVFFSGFWGGW